LLWPEPVLLLLWFDYGLTANNADFTQFLEEDLHDLEVDSDEYPDSILEG
jgi:hypothetical protein